MYEGLSSTNHFSCRKTDSPFSRCKKFSRSYFDFVTFHAFDRQTDGRTAASWLIRVKNCNYRKRGNCDALQLEATRRRASRPVFIYEAAHNAPAYEVNTFATHLCGGVTVMHTRTEFQHKHIG